MRGEGYELRDPILDGMKMLREGEEEKGFGGRGIDRLEMQAGHATAQLSTRHSKEEVVKGLEAELRQATYQPKRFVLGKTREIGSTCMRKTTMHQVQVQVQVQGRLSVPFDNMG
jgi:hypothetical protein